VLQAYAEGDKNFEQVVWQAANQIDQLVVIFCCIHQNFNQLSCSSGIIFWKINYIICLRKEPNIFKNNFISFLDTLLHFEDEQNELKIFSTILDNFSNHPNFFTI
jgi:hypothetical protein